MKSGIELIATERQEQIEKHGWNLKRDADYAKGELIRAAQFCLNTASHHLWPWHDNGVGTHFYNKIISKDYERRIIIAGAFCAAELDRLNGVETFEFNTVLLRSLLQELMIRQQLALPTTEEEDLWWNEGMQPHLITKFFDAAGFGQSYPDGHE